MSGRFITFEGGEGSGKSTQIQRLYEALVSQDIHCVLTREPGGCASAEAIRALLVEGSGDKWHPVAETLLFQAARVEHCERVIRPALAQGKIVLCDRFVDSTLVYQGIAKGLGVEYVRALHRMSVGSLMPQLTFLLDIDPEIGLQRAGARKGAETRFENMDAGFHRQVREGFLALAAQEPRRFAVIDASRSQDEVYTAILAAYKRRFA
jgi:dTMP kinase